MSDGYQLYEGQTLVAGFKDGEALARYLMHHGELLKDPYAVVPITIARIPKLGKVNEQDVKA